jgi:GNAT superfamily N-acetyltransferase
MMYSDEVLEWRQGEITVSTDKRLVDPAWVHAFLSHESYWAQGRPLETVIRSIENSLVFGAYDGDQPVGFARVVTDTATFGWICDVFVLENRRGQGVGKFLVECVRSHPALSGIRRLLLATRDAHELYRRYGGFSELKAPERWMERLSER